MNDSPDGGKTVASVEKAVALLNAIAASENGMSVTELSRSLGYGVSATYHLLNTLRQQEYLQQDAQTRRYNIGLGIFRLHALAQRQNTLPSIVQPYLDELSNVCGETSNLMVLQDEEAVYIAQSESSHMIKMFTQIGARVPYYCTGGGKVILAYLPDEVQGLYIKRARFIPFTKHTLSDKKSLERELKKIRRQGYSIDNEEREEGVTCIAAPVFNAAGTPIAAISVSGPTYRLEQRGQDKLIGYVLQSAKKLSVRMGCQTV